MKCISRKISFILILLISVTVLSGCIGSSDLVLQYESEQYSNSESEYSELFAEDLCVANEDISLDNFQLDSDFHAVALFGLEQEKVLFSEHLHEQLYPASTTKLLTLYVALKHGDLEGTVTVSREAVSVPSDSSVAGLQEGDRLLFQDLLYGLMLPSGNDAAVAVAEYVSGTEEAFVELMNQEARLLGATNTHFTSPHGYQDEEHYTTAYDLYLVLNEAVKDETFCEIVSSASHSAMITDRNNIPRTVTWYQTNQFVNGQREVPEGVTVIGGKTGTTSEAGACLTLYVTNDSGEDFIAIMMGADTKPVLYDYMTDFLSVIPTL